MSVEILLIGGIITLINSLFLNSINRTISRKEKLEEEKIDRIEKAFVDLSKKMDAILKHHDRIIEIVGYIIFEHKRNHGDSEYLDNLYDKIRE